MNGLVALVDTDGSGKWTICTPREREGFLGITQLDFRYLIRSNSFPAWSCINSLDNTS